MSLPATIGIHIRIQPRSDQIPHNNVEHFDWIIHPMTNSYYFDPVVATLQNECPGLQITQREVTQSGIRLSFRY